MACDEPTSAFKYEKKLGGQGNTPKVNPSSLKRSKLSLLSFATIGYAVRFTTWMNETDKLGGVDKVIC